MVTGRPLDLQMASASGGQEVGYPPPSSSMRVYLPRFHSHCTVCIICRVKSEQTPSSFVMGNKSTNVRHPLGLGHRSTGRSLLNAISFYKHHSCPVQYHTETTEQKLLLSRKVVPPTANNDMTVRQTLSCFREARSPRSVLSCVS